MLCQNTNHIGQVIFIFSPRAELHGNQIFAGDNSHIQHLIECTIWLGKLANSAGIGFRVYKIRIQPAVRESKSVTYMVDGILHYGYRGKDSVNIRSHFPESVAFDNGSTADENNFYRQLSAAQPLVLLGQLPEIQIKIVFGKNLMIFS